MKKNPSPANAKPTPTELLARCEAMLGESVTSEELLELVMQMLAQELLTKKLQGQSICDNLKLLGYLTRYASLKLRLTTQRLREQKAEAKSSTTKARLEKPSPPAVVTVKRPSLEDKAYLESILEQYGRLPKERPHHPTNKFRINLQLLDQPFLDDLSQRLVEMTEKAAA